MSLAAESRQTERALTVTRVLNAPRDMVFKAWTDPKQLIKWWGPTHHPATQLDMDVRTGGRWRNRLTSVETGEDLWHHGVFREVLEPERLVFTFTWEEEGERGVENLVTITLEDLGGKTRLTLHQVPFQSDAERDGHGEGWSSTFGRLADYLRQSRNAPPKFGEGRIDISRVFDAPRALVWKAWTDPKMMAQWFGPRGFTSSVPELDVQVGGALRIVMHGPDGNDYPMRGEFLEVTPPARLVFTNIAIDGDGNHLLEGETTVTLTEQNGKTTLRVVSHAVGKVPMAPQMLAGMEAGWTQSIDKLGELVH